MTPPTDAEIAAIIRAELAPLVHRIAVLAERLDQIDAATAALRREAAALRVRLDHGERVQ